MWKCPNCKTHIESLEYEVNTSGSEYGTAYLDDEPDEEQLNPETRSRHEVITDYEYSDRGDEEWTDGPDFRCHECEAYLSISDLIWEEKEEKTEKPSNEPEETLHNIIKPENYIIKDEMSKDIVESSIICKQCFHVFIHNSDRGFYPRKDDFCECPKCGQSNSVTEFKELLAKGVFDKKRKNATKKTKSRSISTLGKSSK